MSAVTHRITLSAHPSTPSDAIEALEVQVHGAPAGVLTLSYSLQADMARVRAATEAAESRADGLWKHTCFEVFIDPGTSGEYYELNFSPARQWAAYRFDTYRQGMTPLQLANPPQISVRRSPHRLELDAVVQLRDGAPGGKPQHAKLALSAVVEDENGRLCYWAARHPSGRPDFHHPAGFVLELQP